MFVGDLRIGDVGGQRGRPAAVIVPSSSPIMKVARLPRSTTPGSSMSAPKFTHASTTRSGPTASASTAVFSPFCSETT